MVHGGEKHIMSTFGILFQYHLVILRSLENFDHVTSSDKCDTAGNGGSFSFKPQVLNFEHKVLALQFARPD